MDDAGGGRRGTRAVVSGELWEVLAARWAIPRQQGRDLGGSLNLNLLVSRAGEQLVVRVHRPSVRPARLEAIEAARDRLDAAGVPCSARVPAHDGARWARAGDRLVEVERYIPHNGRMNTPPRLARGLPILGRIHTLLADAEVSPAGRTVEFANYIEPGAVLAATGAGTARIRSWHPTPAEQCMAVQAERLAELVAAGEAGLAPGLPRQLTHGDFWDDNVFFQDETPVFVADFSFMAERARIDDMALTLYYADTELGQTTSGDRIAALQPLVRAYVSGLDVPLTATEQQALPWAIARQPLWGIGGWVAVLDDPDTAWAHARATFPAVQRALQLVADIDTWQTRLTWRAPNTQLSTALRQFRHTTNAAPISGNVRGLPTAIDHALQPAPRRLCGAPFRKAPRCPARAARGWVHVCGRRTHRQTLGAPPCISLRHVRSSRAAGLRPRHGRQSLRWSGVPGDTGLMTCHQHPPAGEVPIPGGRMASGIVRRGDRLLRPMGPWSPAVHEYLRHLEAAGFAGSPRVLGTESNREVLTFIEGDVAVDPHWQPGHGHRLPPYARTDAALRGAAKLIRKLHSAAAGFAPVITSYRFDPRPPQPGEVVSHGDLGPWNTVYRDGTPVAFIDWDSAGPVDPLTDLAAAAWTFVPLAPPRQLSEAGFDPLPDLPARLRTFVDAYGLADRKVILPGLQRCRPDQREQLRWLQDIAADLARTL